MVLAGQENPETDVLSAVPKRYGDVEAGNPQLWWALQIQGPGWDVNNIYFSGKERVNMNCLITEISKERKYIGGEERWSGNLRPCRQRAGQGPLRSDFLYYLFFISFFIFQNTEKFL